MTNNKQECVMRMKIKFNMSTEQRGYLISSAREGLKKLHYGWNTDRNTRIREERNRIKTLKMQRRSR